MNKYADDIIQVLRSEQNADKAAWLENYVKHSVKSFGVGIPAIRGLLKQYAKDNQLAALPVSSQIDFLDGLMEHEYTEPKLAAILYMQLFWGTKRSSEVLEASSHWFDKGWIYDWNVCDWLCVRLLTPLLDIEPELSISVFDEWNQSQKLWKARASLVPFALSKNLANHRDTVLHYASELIKREERFCKTAVGWVLREYSKLDKKTVTAFLEEHKAWTSKEVIRNATKYMR